MSVRQNIITALDTRLKTIKTSNGYNTNIGERVYEWRAIDIEKETLDCISYQDPSSELIAPFEENDNADETYHYKKLTVHIYMLTSGTTANAKLRLMIEDILTAIGTDTTFSNTAGKTTLEGDTTEIEQDNKKYGGTRITILIEYKTLAWKD